MGLLNLFKGRAEGADGEGGRRPDGERIGRYVVLNEIGRGGMGRVYKATDGDGNIVAVKTLLAHMKSNYQVLARFLREATIIEKLDHPNICRFIECGEEGGTRFIVMEFVDGRNVRDLIRKGDIDVARAVRIARQTCSALSHAHERQVIHRDMKPENILVTADDVCKVTDFGIARDFDEDDIRLTMPNMVIGSPSYMSPEQKKDTSQADHRSDIYGVGVTLYEMLSGEFPSGLLRLDLIPEDLRAIVSKAIAFNPDERYDTAAAMLEDLAGYASEGAATEDQKCLDKIRENDQLRQFMIEVLYPESVPSVAGAEIARYYRPAAGVGGNYYDFTAPDDLHAGILVGNVCEVPDARSAIFLSMVRSTFRICAAETVSPAEALRRTNAVVAREQLDYFAVFSYAVYDAASRRLTTASAGYRPAMVLQAADGQLVDLHAEGIGVGIASDTRYDEESIQLAYGDLVVMCSSGVADLRNQRGEEFGEDRIRQFIRRHATATTSLLPKILEQELAAFSQGVAQTDDLTAVFLRVLPASDGKAVRD